MEVLDGSRLQFGMADAVGGLLPCVELDDWEPGSPPTGRPPADVFESDWFMSDVPDIIERASLGGGGAPETHFRGATDILHRLWADIHLHRLVVAIDLKGRRVRVQSAGHAATQFLTNLPWNQTPFKGHSKHSCPRSSAWDTCLPCMPLALYAMLEKDFGVLQAVVTHVGTSLYTKVRGVNPLCELKALAHLQTFIAAPDPVFTLAICVQGHVGMLDCVWNDGVPCGRVCVVRTDHCLDEWHTWCAMVGVMSRAEWDTVCAIVPAHAANAYQAAMAADTTAFDGGGGGGGGGGGTVTPPPGARPGLDSPVKPSPSTKAENLRLKGIPRGWSAACLALTAVLRAFVEAHFDLEAIDAWLATAARLDLKAI